MIKGCSKRVIVMKETGSDIIEEAFFILKPQAVKKCFSGNDIMTQAKMLLEKENTNKAFSKPVCSVVRQKRKAEFILPFILGLMLGALVSALIVLRLQV